MFVSYQIFDNVCGYSRFCGVTQTLLDLSMTNFDTVEKLW